MKTDLERIWKKRIKYAILEDISKLSTNLDSLTQHFAALEKNKKAKLFEAYLCQVNSVLDTKNQIEEDLKNTFLNLFCTYFDPHTNYFSVAEKSNFMSGMSTSTLSLGLNFQFNEKEEIIITEIDPGGPAAKTNQFEIEDILIKVATTKGIQYTVSCSSIEKIGKLIFSDLNRELELTIQKKNGTIATILLEKQVMKANNNAVYSFIVEKETKVGYINIPSFYSNFDGNTKQGCADDVASEIIKLKKEDIQGLVIDLQDNGGGSIEEAIKMLGMFIKKGPLSILVNNQNDQIILEVCGEDQVYNDPIIVLINGNSASASELFAAAIQDYNRGLIIGANSLGKATMQSILPLDENTESDFVKITVEKFYRITGKSNQIKGIIPDIALPILFDSIISREINYKTAFKNEAIVPKIRFTALPRKQLEQVVKISKERVQNATLFNEINLTNQLINSFYNLSKKPTRLAFKDVFEDVHEIDPIWEKVAKIAGTKSNFTICNTSEDIKKFKKDPFLHDLNTYKIKNLETNPYIQEALAILNDYNNLIAN